MTTQQDDTTAIRDLVHAAYAAWGRNDAAAYAAHFTDDSDYIAFDGSHLHGRAANEKAHADLFAGVLRGTRIVGDIDDLKFLGPDVALVHTRGAVLFPWQQDTPTALASVQTMIATRTDQGWRFAAFHNTRVRPLPQGGLLVRAFAWWVRVRTALAQASAPATG